MAAWYQIKTSKPFNSSLRVIVYRSFDYGHENLNGLEVWVQNVQSEWGTKCGTWDSSRPVNEPLTIDCKYSGSENRYVTLNIPKNGSIFFCQIEVYENKIEEKGSRVLSLFRDILLPFLKKITFTFAS